VGKLPDGTATSGDRVAAEPEVTVALLLSFVGMLLFKLVIGEGVGLLLDDVLICELGEGVLTFWLVVVPSFNDSLPLAAEPSVEKSAFVNEVTFGAPLIVVASIFAGNAIF